MKPGREADARKALGWDLVVNHDGVMTPPGERRDSED